MFDIEKFYGLATEQDPERKKLIEVCIAAAHREDAAIASFAYATSYGGEDEDDAEQYAQPYISAAKKARAALDAYDEAKKAALPKSGTQD